MYFALIKNGDLNFKHFCYVLLFYKGRIKLKGENMKNNLKKVNISVIFINSVCVNILITYLSLVN